MPTDASLPLAGSSIQPMLADSLVPETIPTGVIPPQHKLSLDDLEKLLANGPGGELPRVTGYEVFGILGEGGMGTVYRARQIKADRIVALKMPFASASPELRIRFRTEAKAIARFQHPNIVQVFEVGETDQVPYMALELCPGGSLSDRLDGTPLPPRDAAEVSEIVARAVAAAHAAGIIHRDLKPSNILLGINAGSLSTSSDVRVASLLPKVSDFGLARQLDLDNSQTRTGAVIGTPSYMAPEQARGDTKLVGPRADVYALGAILYELLTGRPPFKGTTVLETLDQVCTQEPVSPSRFQPHIQRDLETITLKCLRKEPEKRYQTADELADDLNRYLTGRPVLARPVGWPERVIKRARRNPLATALLLLLATAVTVGAGFGVWKQVRMVAERDRARSHFQMSMRAIEELLTEVARSDLATSPRAEKTRQRLLEKALRFYEELSLVEADDPTLAWEAARAARRVGDIYRLLSRYSDAKEAYDNATARIGRLRAAGRDDPEIRREEALVHNWRGEVFRLTERLDEADAEYQKAAAIQTLLRDSDPGHADYALELAQSLYNRGIAAGTRRRYAEAEGHFREAKEALARTDAVTPGHRQHTARIAINLSDVLRKDGRAKEAVVAVSDAIGPLDSLITGDLDRLEYRHERAMAGINLSIALSAAGDKGGAVTTAIDARQRLADLVKDFPSMSLFRVDLARVCTCLAEIEAGRNKPAAEAHTRAAVGHWEALLALRPNVPSDHGELGMALGNLGRLTIDRPTEARGPLTRALPELLIALKANPDIQEFRNSLRSVTRDLAKVLVQTGEDIEIARQAEAIGAGLPGPTYGTWTAVCFLARAAAAVQKLPGSPADAGRRVEGFGKQAAELIRKGDAAALAPLLEHPDCEPFRSLPVFREAFGRIEK